MFWFLVSGKHGPRLASHVMSEGGVGVLPQTIEGSVVGECRGHLEELIVVREASDGRVKAIKIGKHELKK